MSFRAAWHKAIAFLRQRALVGWRRSALSLFPAIQMTLGAVGAFSFSSLILHHQGPIFAATTAIISLGFARDTRFRRVIEVALGCSIGILIGDTLMHILGAGIWQGAVVLFISIMLARFIEGSPLFTTQMGLQSLLVVLLPTPSGGPFTRSIDAVVGGVIALLITLAAPQDPRRVPQSTMREVVDELSSVLRDCAKALIKDDSTLAFHALSQARACQPLIDTVQASLRSSREFEKLAPGVRRHRAELRSLAHAAKYFDLAIRSARVLARRIASSLSQEELTEVGKTEIADALEKTADAVDTLGRALMEKSASARRKNVKSARAELDHIAVALHPKDMKVVTLAGEGIILLLRPLVVDLLVATGISQDDAVQLLPRL